MKLLLVILCAQMSFCQTTPEKKHHRPVLHREAAERSRAHINNDAAINAIIDSLKTNDYTGGESEQD